MAIDPIEEQRRLMFEALTRAGAFYDRPEAGELLGMLMGQARGGPDAGPFNQQVQSNMLAENADAGAGAFSTSRDQLRRSFANAGLTGSGLEGSALYSAQNRTAAQVSAGRRSIRTRAELENYSARERAQAQAMGFLQQQETARRQAAQAEAEMRSRITETTNESGPGPASSSPRGAVAPAAPPPAPVPAPPPRPTVFGRSNSTPMAPIQNQAAFGFTGWNGPGGLGSFSGAGGLANANSQYQQALQQQQQDYARLLNNQADWDARYGGR